jgi:hypothetical protein
MLIIGGIGLKYGKPQRLSECATVGARGRGSCSSSSTPSPGPAPGPAVYATDYRGNVCGVDSPVQSKKYTAYPRTQEDFLVNIAKTDPLQYKFYGARPGGRGGVR